MADSGFNLSRRTLMCGVASVALTVSLGGCGGFGNGRATNGKVSAVPLNHVRLTDSPFLDAVEANKQYLLFLSPDRLLHNFHKFAGLPVRGEIYGGWESDTIAGEALGHYLTALSLMYAQTGEPECIDRIKYIIGELEKIQNAHGDGYVAGFMRKRKDGSIVDGKEIFPEIMAGDIRSAGFDLNGCWVPFYNWHKLYAGLLDVQLHTGIDRGIPVLEKLGGYIENVFNALSPEQIQTVLDCEHGGINESFAELFARTGNERWLNLSEKLYHKRILDPLAAQEDKLMNNHANTQVPKLIGLARLHELTNKSKYKAASNFFWDRVVHHHSFVIGGNADREYFFAPDTIADHVTEQTCESCNTYNMLKLTRHLYSWQPTSDWFDYYERAHLNHILAHQDPENGMFTYMMPLMAGSARHYSTPEDSFWCCVCSGMESHSKHGDSIWWQNGDKRLYVNLFIPSQVDWKEQDATFELTTKYPYEGSVGLSLNRIGKSSTFAVALRIPGWASGYTVMVNGTPIKDTPKADGYVVIEREWNQGDQVTLEMPLELRLETPPGNDKVVSLLRGPMVLAADLGAADEEWESTTPALVSESLLASLEPVSVSDAVYRTKGSGRPADMTFRPFYSQYHRRTAVYFNKYTNAEWAVAEKDFQKAEALRKEIAARSVDIIHLGEMQQERDHNLNVAGNSYPVVYRRRQGRDARTGGYFEFEMNVLKDGQNAGPLVLQATYWGSEFNRSFTIEIDGKVIAHERLQGRQPGAWIDVKYPVPYELTKGKSKVVVKFNAQEGKTAGPVFGVSLFTAETESKKT